MISRNQRLIDISILLGTKSRNTMKSGIGLSLEKRFFFDFVRFFLQKFYEEKPLP